jgi:hypothetical protein
MKRRGCVECHLIEPAPGEWRDGLCPRCWEARRAKLANQPAPPPKPQPRDATVERLRGHMADLAKRHPEIWREADQLRAQRASLDWDVRWPESRFLPTASVVLLGQRLKRIITDIDEIDEPYPHTSLAAALINWRPTQGIYRFDPALLADVWDTHIGSGFPAEALQYLPEWCVYVETPGNIDMPSPGFFAFLDWRPEQRLDELRIVIEEDSGFNDVLSIGIDLSQKRLAAAIRTEIEHAIRGIEGYNPERAAELAAGADRVTDIWVKLVTPRVSLLLYLCDAKAEMIDRKTGKLRPLRPKPTKTKNGMRMFPPDQPAAWDVGYRMGPALRRELEQERGKPGEGTHASPRGHTRKAHWHWYWRGPKAKPGVARTEERRLVHRWVRLTKVNLKDDDGVIPTIHPVR